MSRSTLHSYRALLTLIVAGKDSREGKVASIVEVQAQALDDSGLEPSERLFLNRLALECVERAGNDD